MREIVRVFTHSFASSTAGCGRSEQRPAFTAVVAPCRASAVCISEVKHGLSLKVRLKPTCWVSFVATELAPCVVEPTAAAPPSTARLQGT
jgi:hypothetical protein